MATVYLAQDVKHDRNVALKVLKPEMAAALGTERFHREIEIAARLMHPNILQLHDSGEVDGLRYYVMPYVEGETLADRIQRERRMPLETAMKIAQQIARALDHAHSHGIVHRDIKPGNVLLVGDQPIVADFGIARVEGALGTDRLTQMGLSMGTPHYMSPEQVTGERAVDGRADIYSLGCVLYEMIAGAPPFAGLSTQAVLARHSVDDLPSLRTVRRTVSPGLEDIVRKATAKVPADRFSTGDEMAEALERARTTQVRTVQTTGLRGRRRWAWRGVALGIGVAAAVVVATLVPRTEAPSGPVPAELDSDLIALAPFRVTTTGTASFADLGAGIPELMYLRLAGDDGLRAVYPGTADPVWRRLSDGGSLTDSLALQGAWTLRAGRLVLGHVLVTGEQAVLNASLYDVLSRRVTARVSDVTGPLDDILPLIDELAVELLIRGSGEGESRLGYFVGSDLGAVRAYLAGQAAFHQSRYSEAQNHFLRALDLDSTFAVAGLQLVVANSYELDASVMNRGLDAAWAGREKLTSRDRILLDAFRSNSAPSILDRIVAWDSAAALMPDRKTVQFLQADYLYHYGAAVATRSPWARAEAGFRTVLEIDPDHGPALAHLFELAAMRGDESAPELGARYLADANRDYGPYYRWRLDRLAGQGYQTDFVARMAHFDEGSLSRIVTSAQQDGHDMRYAVAAAEERVRRSPDLRSARHDMRLLALNRGRPSEARQIRSSIQSLGPERYDPLIDVFDALYWGGDSTMAAASIAARAQADVSLPAGGVTAGVSPHYIDACALGLWRMGIGDDAGASDLVRTLSDYAMQLEGSAKNSALLCAQIIDADLAFAEGRHDADDMLARLDSLARRQYFAAFEILATANLTLAKLYENGGALERALGALERRRYGAWGALHGLSTFLYHESRLASLIGDRDRAVRASRLYLNLRDDPEPVHAAQADSVRARLEALGGIR